MSGRTGGTVLLPTGPTVMVPEAEFDALQDVVMAARQMLGRITASRVDAVAALGDKHKAALMRAVLRLMEMQRCARSESRGPAGEG